MVVPSTGGASTGGGLKGPDYSINIDMNGGLGSSMFDGKGAMSGQITKDIGSGLSEGRTSRVPVGAGNAFDNVTGKQETVNMNLSAGANVTGKTAGTAVGTGAQIGG